MSLILYPTTETAFDNNGIGILSDAIDAEVYEELNGQFELTVQYPVEGVHFSEIVADAYITAKPDPVRDPQPFRIYRITKPMRGVVTIYARHMAYRNRKIVVSPFRAVNAPDVFHKLKACAVNACPFEFWTDKGTAAEMKVSVPTDIWTLLGSSQGSILDTYGGEYEFDRYTVRLWDHRGTDRGVSIRYGKNLTDLKQDENVANVFTGVYPYWTDGSGGLVTLKEKYISGPGTYTEEKIMPLDLSQAFDSKPTEDQLRERAKQYIEDNNIGKPDISWTVEFVQLEQTEEYKGQALLERVLLGDTVSVIFPKLGVDAAARAVAARYKPLLGRYKNITLGRVKSNLATTIVQQKQEIEQAKKPSNLDAAVDRATSWITGGSGYMIAVRNEDGVWSEICSLDEPDINAALKVWRWNNAGFAYSATGYNGPYRLAITQEGEIVADFITTGTLDAAVVNVINLAADSISTGTLSSKDGALSIDLDNKRMNIRTPCPDGGYQGFMFDGNCISGIIENEDLTEYTKYFEMIFLKGATYIGDGFGPDASAGNIVAVAGSGGLLLGTLGKQTEIRASSLIINGKRAVWAMRDGAYVLTGYDV